MRREEILVSGEDFFTTQKIFHKLLKYKVDQR